MVIRMRATRSHTGNRRSHHALKANRAIVCSNCGKAKLPHAVCAQCGMYKGKQIVDVAGRLAKKAKKQKEKAQA